MFTTPLSSKLTNGQYLTAAPNKKAVVLGEEPDLWKFTPVDFPNLYSVSNEKNGRFVCANQDNLNVDMKNTHSDYCDWAIGTKGELIAIKPKMFAWVVGGELKLIQDGFVADNWIELANKAPKSETSRLSSLGAVLVGSLFFGMMLLGTHGS